MTELWPRADCVAREDRGLPMPESQAEHWRGFDHREPHDFIESFRPSRPAAGMVPVCSGDFGERKSRWKPIPARNLRNLPAFVKSFAG